MISSNSYRFYKEGNMDKDERYFVDSKNKTKESEQDAIDQKTSDQNASEQDAVGFDPFLEVIKTEHSLIKQQLEEIYLKIANEKTSRKQFILVKDKEPLKSKPFRTIYKGRTGMGAKAPVFFEQKTRKVSHKDDLPPSFSEIDLEKIKKETDSESFGEYLAFLRKNKKMDVDDLCARAVINRSLYYSYLNKTKSPRKDTLKRIILILKLTGEEAQRLWTLCGFGISLFEDKVFFACLQHKIFDIVVINQFFKEKGIEQIEIPPER